MKPITKQSFFKYSPPHQQEDDNGNIITAEYGQKTETIIADIYDPTKTIVVDYKLNPLFNMTKEQIVDSLDQEKANRDRKVVDDKKAIDDQITEVTKL